MCEVPRSQTSHSEEEEDDDDDVVVFASAVVVVEGAGRKRRCRVLRLRSEGGRFVRHVSSSPSLLLFVVFVVVFFVGVGNVVDSVVVRCAWLDGDDRGREGASVADVNDESCATTTTTTAQTQANSRKER